MTIDLPDHGVQEITIKGVMRTPASGLIGELRKEVASIIPKGFGWQSEFYQPRGPECDFAVTATPYMGHRYCSYCREQFYGNDEAIDTADSILGTSLTLCRACYDKAGNKVR